MTATTDAPLGHDQLFPSRRVVLLGASNVTRLLSVLVETACRFWGRPLDLLGAFGHGRSYGLRVPVLGRELPGIVECGLWRALERRPPAPTAALVTDVGNDILYDVPVPEIAGWVEVCLDRLLSSGARIVLTSLPLRSITRLSPARYLLARRILFPGCQLPYGEALARALDLDQRLRTLAAKRGIRVAEQRPEWYGFDPIHIRRWWGPRAWREILSGWSDAGPLPPLALP
jgi:hypothetical protein